MTHAALRPTEILPGIGFGSLVFGMTVEEVEASVGAPLDSQRETGEGYSYLVRVLGGISLFFDQAEGYRLDSIEVDERSQAHFLGQQLFPRSYADVLTLLRRNLPGIEVSEIKDISLLREISIGVPSLAMRFYFDPQNWLQDVHWGPLVDSQDQVVWPSRLLKDSSARVK